MKTVFGTFHPRAIGATCLCTGIDRIAETGVRGTVLDH